VKETKKALLSNARDAACTSFIPWCKRSSLLILLFLLCYIQGVFVQTLRHDSKTFQSSNKFESCPRLLVHFKPRSVFATF